MGCNGQLEKGREMLELVWLKTNKKVLGANDKQVYVFIYSVFQQVFGITSSKALEQTENITNGPTEDKNEFYRKFKKAWDRAINKDLSPKHIENIFKKMLKEDWGFKKEDF